jgi:hypothetical protein
MRKYFILAILCLQTFGTFAQSAEMPKWFLDDFKSLKLNDKFVVSPFPRPAFLAADFNGDGADDVAVLVVAKNSKKKGPLIINQNLKAFYVIAASSKFGKSGFDEFDDLDWLDGWELFTDKTAYETKFDNGDIVGSTPRKLKYTAISMWKSEDGAPVYGGLIYWDGQKYDWIHQGE